MKSKIVSLIVSLFGVGVASSFGASLNILWYTGGVTSSGGSAGSSYQSAINNLVTQEESAFNISGSINTWNVTYWDTGSMPTGSFNVLVGASPQGGWGSYPDYSGTSAIMMASGSNAASDYGRVMLTGQDADWHYQFGPGPSSFNGPAGFLIDAINWAGSGTGMGGVFLGSTGWGIFSGVGTNTGANDTVNIPGAFSSYPINVGLTSAGLSGWGTSAHDSFSGADTSKWTSINVNGAGVPITIVSAASAGGGTTPGVPDAASTALLCLMGAAALVAARRFAGRSVGTAN